MGVACDLTEYPLGHQLGAAEVSDGLRAMAAVVSRLGSTAELNTLLSIPRLLTAIDGVKRRGPHWNRAVSPGSAGAERSCADATPASAG
jgi:hypothetical protein